MKNNNDLTESDKYSIKKVQMRHELNIKDSVPDEALNECLILYDKNKATIDRILDRYLEEEIDDEDSYDGGKSDNLNNAFQKVIDCLDCEFVEGVKQYDKDDFERRIKGLRFTQGEKNSLQTRGKLEKQYEIVKLVLGKFGISLTAPSKRIRNNGVQVRIKTYEISYEEQIWSLIFCKILNSHNRYLMELSKFTRKYDKYKKILKEINNKKIFRKAG